jgi:uncharacterized Fe-S cluster protein YjdI
MDTKEITKEYSNGEVIIIWKPSMCMHASFCWRELPEVFDPKKRPWINPKGATSERIIEQVKRCPSGALSYRMENEKEPEKTQNTTTVMEIEVVAGGPFLVHGELKIKDAEGKIITRNGLTALCRCGASKNKPYCDGSHQNIDFDK